MGVPSGIQSLGGAMTNLGGIEQAFRGNDIANLTNSGRMARGYEQAVLDTQRQNAYALAMEPYNRLSYLAEFASPNYMGSGQSMRLSQQQQALPSPFQAALTNVPPGNTIGGGGFNFNPLSWFGG